MFLKGVSISALAIWLFTGCQPLPADYTNIKEFGALGDSITLDTKSIQKAIDQAAQNGGGTVFIPAGTYRIGTVFLKENVSIFFDTGAKWIGSTRLEEYQTEDKSLIIGHNLSNVSLSGMGVIDGSGRVFWDEKFKALERPEPWILLNNCKHLLIKDLKFTNSPSHTIRLENSEDVRFDNLSIINPFKGPNTDGIDLVDSKNIMISNCFISTGDDAICLKSQKDTVENVVVTNCILESDDAAIKFGTGSKIATRYCTFDNIVIKRTRYGISLFMLDGGVFEHNRFSNLLIENASRHKHEYPIFVDIDKRVPDRPYGKIINNTFSNIKMVTDGKVLISGHPESFIENLKLENISFFLEGEKSFNKAKKPRGNKNYPKLKTSTDLSPKPAHIVLGYTDGLTLEDVAISAPPEHETKRESFYLEQVQNVEKRNLKALK